MGALWCHLGALCSMGAVLPHVGAMCDCMGVVTPYGSHMMPFAPSGAGWEPWAWGGSREAIMYIWFYSSRSIATLGATVAKERRCGACRRLVFTPNAVYARK
jgi:hypothetical protein